MRGVIDYNPGNPHNTNLKGLMDPKYAKLAPYTQSPGIYRCPADKSTVKPVEKQCPEFGVCRSARR